MPPVPAALGLAFALTTGLTVWLFCRAARQSRRTLAVLLAWLLLHTGLGLSNFYVAPEAMPPRLLLALGPPMLLILGLFLAAPGRAYLDGLHLETLTLLHVVRVPVELVLLGLFLYRAAPQLLTFEGRNWDMLSGLSAPLVYSLAFWRQQVG